MISVRVIMPEKYSDSDVISAVSEKLFYGYWESARCEIKSYRVLKRCVETRNKPCLSVILTVGINLKPETEAFLLKNIKYVKPVPDYTFAVTKRKTHLSYRPVVIGCGPCGLFAALILAEAGERPLLLERGTDVDSRKTAVDSFFGGGELCEENNVQFGEGGAGAFSDGKLKYGSLDKNKYKVLSAFVSCGAPESILYDENPHIGTDRLSCTIKNLRKKIISLGGEVRFSCRVCDFEISDHAVSGVYYECKNVKYFLRSDNIILATGHSARDVYKLLDKIGAKMESRPFGIGVRIEHPQSLINKLIYSKQPSDEIGAASYHLVTHLACGRSVYSFCMCPGGSVVAATSQENSVVTNGMSNYARDGKNANAAFLVGVNSFDFDGISPLAGITLQTKLEQAAFAVAGDYRAPCITLEDFLKNKAMQSFADVLPTYPRGTVSCPPREFLPDFIYNPICAAILEFERWMPGFYYPGAVVTGTETRSTAPVRILRNESCECENISGLYPCGEGAGYGGGIVSSACDGIRAAEAILGRE